MNQDFIAKAEISISAPVSKVWDALTNPEIIKQYMFGSEVVSDWKVGSPIVWKGIWKDKPYEDKGVILQIEPEKILKVTHFSPLSGVEDKPENYHALTYELTALGEETQITLSQDNNANEEEKNHSQKMWETMLSGLKSVLEK